jgi:hypothetical protein
MKILNEVYGELEETLQYVTDNKLTDEQLKASLQGLEELQHELAEVGTLIATIQQRLRA